MAKVIVLYSGGKDSQAALIWALATTKTKTTNNYKSKNYEK